jgi:hypothetical protein
MKQNDRSLGAVLILAMAVALAGCSKSAQNAMTESGAAAAASGSASMTKTLVDQLGGMSTVSQLAEAFGANLTASPLAKVLDPAAITQTQQGLVNEVAKASAMPAPHPGSDMLAALSGKVTDPEGVGTLTNALSAAADQMHIGATEKTALMALLAPITSRLLGK